jgi:hypothetical protein
VVSLDDLLSDVEFKFGDEGWSDGADVVADA